jgi:hypothetical protein
MKKLKISHVDRYSMGLGSRGGGGLGEILSSIIDMGVLPPFYCLAFVWWL